MSVPQLLFANMGVASVMLGAFYAYCTGTLAHAEVKFDIVESAMLAQLPVKKKEELVEAVR